MKKLNSFIRDFRLFFRRKREDKFDYIFSLGYNCEVAFRFYNFFRFEESNLFNWTYSNSIDNLIYAIKNFDEIGAADYENPNPLWECKNTHIRFHGKADMSNYENGNFNEDLLNKDKNDLIERIEYLKSKFKKMAQNNSRKLYVYKIKSEDFISQKVEELYKTLREFGCINFKLLIICEKKVYKELPYTDKNIVIRSVDYFAPDEDVTGSNYLDNGFDKVWEEFFTTSKKKKKNKKYKFE